jgi:hypothetical protein
MKNLDAERRAAFAETRPTDAQDGRNCLAGFASLAGPLRQAQGHRVEADN